MLHPQWRTENAHCGSREDLPRNNYLAGTSVLSLGIARPGGGGLFCA